MPAFTTKEVRALDRRDPLKARRREFFLPKGITYLDGNSLGALPKAVEKRLAALTRKEWGEDLITSWEAHGWIGLPQKVGDKLAPLIGAHKGEVICADSTSINLYKAVKAALQLNPRRKVIVTEKTNFPTDLYVLEGIARETGAKLKRVAADRITGALDKSVAVLALTHVNFRTSAMHDLPGLTKAAKKAGALTVWDLSHSAGAVPVHLNRAGADFAVGCGYKYLNAGPGGPGYIFAARRHQNRITPALPGWMGHQSPFDFSHAYKPAKGIQRQLTGTPFVHGLAAFDAALDAFKGVTMKTLYAKARTQGEIFLAIALEDGAEFGLEPACPPDSARRGSQVTLRHEAGFAVMQALIAKGIIGDFRPPAVLRFGFAPLYLSYREVFEAAHTLVDILASGAYKAPRFRKPKTVT